MKQFGQKTAIIFAIIAAALYAVSSPVSKLLLEKMPPTMMAALLYLGAGLGMSILTIIKRATGRSHIESHLAKKELPYIIGMVVLDIVAPVLLMFGLSMTTAANTSLLNNFEIVATSIIALCVFKEKVPKNLWFAIVMVTMASILLSLEDVGSFSFSTGSVFVLLACICWGFENNCTRMLANNNPMKIVVIKGICSGFGSLLIALIIGERMSQYQFIFAALLLGFVAYGLSIYFYVYAQRYLGAAKTSTFYAIAPFIGVAFSLLIFREIPSVTFFIALGIMIAGTYFASKAA